MDDLTSNVQSEKSTSAASSLFFPQMANRVIEQEKATVIHVFALNRNSKLRSLKRIKMSIVKGPSWVHMEDQQLKIDLVDEKILGDFPVTITASNGVDKVTRTMILHVVKNTIYLPQSADMTVRAGEHRSELILAKSGTPNHKLVLSGVNNPSWVDFHVVGKALDGDGFRRLPVLEITPPQNVSGTYTITIRATDTSTGFSKDMQFKLTVKKTTYSFISTGDFNITSDEIKTFDMKGSGQAGPLTYAIETAPEWVSVDDKGVISMDPKGVKPGTYTFKIRIEDKENRLTDYGTYKVTVDDFVNNPTTYENRHLVNLDTMMTLPKVAESSASVVDSTDIEVPHFISLASVRFEKNDGAWYLVNPTSRPLHSISVKFNDSNKPTLLTFDQEVLPYTKVKFELSDRSVSDIKFDQQMGMYNPHAYYETKDSIDVKAPKEDEKAQLANQLVLIQDTMNKVKLVNKIEDSVNDFNECDKYSECYSYSHSGNNGLNYGLLSYLTVGMEGHKLALKTFVGSSGVYAVGAGFRPDINSTYDDEVGFLALRNSGRHPALTFHEGGHAYGYDHDSQVTQSYASMFDTYNETEADRNGNQPLYNGSLELHTPDILVASQYDVSENKLTLNLYSKYDLNDPENVHFRLMSGKKYDVTTQFDENEDKNTISFKFNKTVTSPIYIQIWDDNAVYVTTVKVKPTDLSPSKVYEIGDKTYTILNKNLLDNKAHYRKVKDYCKSYYLKDNRLANKQDYQDVYNYLKKSDKLSGFISDTFISSNKLLTESTVTFGEDGLQFDTVLKIHRLGQRGVMCVADITK